jgi:hypothetical protein
MEGYCRQFFRPDELEPGNESGRLLRRGARWTQTILGAIGFEQFLADLTLNSPPLIELSGSGNFAETPLRLSVIGRAVIEKLFLPTVPFLKAAGDFSWDGERECCAVFGSDMNPAN